MNMLLDILKGTGRVLLWSAVTLSIVVLVMLGINAVDEDLRPEVATALQPAKPTVPEQDNAFFAFIGLSAPAGIDASEHGRQWIADAATVDSLEMFEKYDKNRLDFAEIKGRFCTLYAQDCFEKARRNSGEVRKILAANEELLGRYEAMLGFPRFEDLSPPRGFEFAPPYRHLSIAHSLKHAQVALLIDEGRLDEGLAVLERQMAFDRRFLGGSTRLKLTAINDLSDDLLFIAEMLRVKRAELAPFAARIGALAAPLDLEQRRMDRVLAAEFRFVASTIRPYRIEGSGKALRKIARIPWEMLGLDDAAATRARRFAVLDPLLARFLKENATLNSFHPLYARIAELSHLPPAGLSDGNRVLTRQAKHDAYNWRLAYNPGGKQMSVAAAEFDLSDDVFRMHDLDGLLRLVALQAAILAEGILDANVAAFIGKSERELFDPYTGKPMQWDAVKGQIWFAPASDLKRIIKLGGLEGRVVVAPWPSDPAIRP